MSDLRFQDLRSFSWMGGLGLISVKRQTSVLACPSKVVDVTLVDAIRSVTLRFTPEEAEAKVIPFSQN